MAKKRVNNIRVIKDPTNPETPEILAASLIKIGDAMEKLCREKGGINKDGIAALVCNLSGMSQVRKNDVLLVLEGLDRLKSYYIRK